MVVERLRHILENDGRLRSRVEQTIEEAAESNPDTRTNPVRSLEDLYAWLERFLTVMPWEGIESGGKGQGLFQRIDQSIGYQYYLFGDLQYEPKIAEWLKQYNTAWAERLNSSESWNDTYFEMLRSDPLFELDGNKYELSANWRCWNDFFARRLAGEYNGAVIDAECGLTSPAEGRVSQWMSIGEDNMLQMPAAIKTTTVVNVADLMGRGQYSGSFAGGWFCHVTLDIYNYHRFHAPCAGTIVDIQEIDGMLTGGGRIIWNAEEHRYRYEQQDNIGYQMMEKRVVIVIEQSKNRFAEGTKNKEQGHLIAVIPVGVAQVGSIRLNEDIKTGSEVRQGQELGCFLCGGSDVIVMKEKDK